MFRNHLLVALRHLRRQKGYSFINVAGLGLGLAVCLLIGLFVWDELSYDRFHEKADRIYRLAVDAQIPGAPPDRFAVSSVPMANALVEDYPEVEEAVRLAPWNPSVKHEGRYYFDDDTFFTEPSFFRVFTFPLVAGDAATALEEPYTIVLTETTAWRYFGSTDVLGQSLTLNDSLTFEVTGVVADVPAHAHFDFDLLASWGTLEQLNPDLNAGDWLALDLYSYVLVQEGAAVQPFAAKVDSLLMDHFGEQLRSVGIEATVKLQPLPDIYLHSDRGAEIGPTGDIRYVYIFAAVALFILILAGINFVNLATARSLQRAKEVGVRKVVGSSRGALVRQFLAESVLVALFALVLALVLVVAALPFFNDIAGKEMAFGTLLGPGMLAVLLGGILLVGTLAGVYPAFVLSSFRPIEVLKGSFRSSGRGVRLRQGLVVFQFAISVALIVGTLVVVRQMAYMQSQPLGFDKDQVLVLDASGLPNRQVAEQYQTLKEAFRQHAAVETVAATNSVPGRQTSLLLVLPEGLADGESRRMQVLMADHDYTEAMGLQIVAGRGFSEDFETDAQSGLLVNEMAVEKAGWGTPEDAIGKTIRIGGGDAEPLTVVGVFRDYHHFSLKQEVEPMIVTINPGAFNFFAVRVGRGNAATTLAGLEATWNRLLPGHTFTYFFLDEDFATQYAAEQRLTRIFGAFATLAILVACLGLFGLASFVTAQRTNEIGVRKVLGASVPGIVVLLSKDFLKLVGIAFVVAAPVAWLAMDRWLEDFAYRVELGPLAFVVAGLLALLIAVATVSYQALRAATSDPVKALRYE